MTTGLLRGSHHQWERNKREECYFSNSPKSVVLTQSWLLKKLKGKLGRFVILSPQSRHEYFPLPAGHSPHPPLPFLPRPRYPHGARDPEGGGFCGWKRAVRCGLLGEGLLVEGDGYEMWEGRWNGCRRTLYSAMSAGRGRVMEWGPSWRHTQDDCFGNVHSQKKSSFDSSPNAHS